MNGRRKNDAAESGPPKLGELLQAIERDDRARASALIKRDGRLAVMGVKTAKLYRKHIHHWLYANDTALHLVAAGYRIEIARLLLAAGADVHASENMRSGRPLHYAADGQPGSLAFDPELQTKMIRCLLQAGADIHVADANGATALHRAVRTRCALAVECLLESGADPMAPNSSGATPFHLAVRNTGRGGSGSDAAKKAQRRIIQAMLARGVSAGIKDARGRTVADWAQSDWIRELLPSSAGNS